MVLLHVLLIEVCDLEVERLLEGPTVGTNGGFNDCCKVKVPRSRVLHLRQPLGVVAAFDRG